MIASNTASDIWSQSLSGWPSVTDSEAKWVRGELAKEDMFSTRSKPSKFVRLSWSAVRRLSPVLPRVQILALLIGQHIDRDAHAVELELGDLAIDLFRHVVDLLPELGVI